MKLYLYRYTCTQRALYMYSSLSLNVKRHRENLQYLIIDDNNRMARCFTKLTTGSDQAVRERAQEVGDLCPCRLQFDG